LNAGAAGPARRGRVGLVCGGGGIVGGVFEVGALRALDEALGGGVVNGCDLYVGASAGSLVATMLAAGITPREMEDVVVRGARNRKRVPPLRRTSVYGLDVASWVSMAARFPAYMASGFLRSLLPGESSRVADAAYEALRVLPSGLFTNDALARYVTAVLKQLDLPDRFRDFPKPLFITAVNLDSGHRVVFGEAGSQDVPIPRAIQASSAVPLLFRPVRIEQQDFVDGGIERNVPVDVAVRAGASLVIAVNPLVPIVNDPGTDGALLRGSRYISERGLLSVADQMFRLLIRSQTVAALRGVREAYPEVDVVLIEPEADDGTLFDVHPMRYSARARLAVWGYEATKARLVRDGESLRATFSRHGLDFDARRLTVAPREGRGKAARWVSRLERLPGLRGWAEKQGEGPDDPFRGR
jgi:predicted acylesterase/phospholipase RssA